jgi:hypothetical protein
MSTFLIFGAGVGDTRLLKITSPEITGICGAAFKMQSLS